ncbi:MAG TPA: AAA family ATPase [Actinomycetota bacterium]|nr:AAA family ATPase [Actinomycetota bacterium]
MVGFEGPVTILFTDVEASTELRTKWGDEDSQEILRSHEAIVREQVVEFGGREVKALGDGFLVVFHSARKAVTCAVAIQRVMDEHCFQNPGREVHVRIGLNTGEVIAEGDDLYGEAIHAAARIAAKAKGGQILSAGVVKELAGTVPDVEWQDRGRFRLKGFPDRRQLFEVSARAETRATPVVAQTPLVGREAERAELLSHLDKARSGQGSLVVIGGEPGVGKTRLAKEIVEEGARRGMLTLVGHCYDSESSSPYIPFVEILESAARGAARSDALRTALGDVAGEVAKIVPELRRQFPDIPPPLDLPPEQERRYLFNSITEFLERATAIRPQLVLLDDLQWADEPTMLLLRHIVERVHEMPLLLVGTYRDVELDVARPLADALEEMLRKRLVTRIALKRLSEDGVAGMLHGLSGAQPPPSLVQTLYAETEGNPFFVEEVFKYLSEEGKLFDAQGAWLSWLAIGEVDVPEGVRLVIGRRLERLSEGTRSALASAAVIGRGFTYGLLKRLSDLDEDALLDALDEAERAHLFTSVAEGGEDTLSFAHELIRQTLLASLSAPRRRRLHLKVVEAMELLYADTLEDHAPEIANHLEQAGGSAESEKTFKYLMMAGERALAAAAFEDATRFFESAYSYTDESPRGRADALYGLGIARRSLGFIDEALVKWRAALEIFEELDESTRIAEVCFEISEQLAWASRWAECLEVAARGLAAMGDSVTLERARLIGLSAIIIANSGDFDTAMAMMDEGESIANEIGDETLLGYVKLARALIHHAAADLREALELGIPGAEVLRSAGDMWFLANFLGFMQFAHFFVGNWNEAEEMGDELEPLARRLGHGGALVFALRSRPNSAFLTGNLDGFAEFVATDLELSRGVGPLHLAQALTFKGVLEFRRGDWDEALSAMVEAVETHGPGFWHQIQLAYLMLMHAYRGEADEARAILADNKDAMPTPGHKGHWGSVNLLLASVEGLFVQGDVEAAGELYPLVLELQETGMLGRAMDVRLVETIAGIAAGAAGERDEAIRHFSDARARAAELGHEFEQPEINRLEAAVLRSLGRPEDVARADELLRGARETYRQIGMPKHVEMCERLMSGAVPA